MKVERLLPQYVDLTHEDVPAEFCCPIGGDLMHDPVTISGTDRTHVYEAANIRTFFGYCQQEGKPAFSPLTRQVLNSTDLVEAVRAYNTIRNYAGQNPQLNHRMARAPATNAAQVCVTLNDFSTQVRHFHSTGHQTALARARNEMMVGSALLTPLIYYTRGVPSTRQNLLLQCVLGVVWGLYMTTQLERAQRSRVKLLSPQWQQSNEVRRALSHQALAPEARKICTAHLDCVDDLMGARPLHYAGGEWALAASLQGVVAGLHVASWGGDQVRSDQAVFLSFLMLFVGVLMVSAISALQDSSFTRPKWLLPKKFDLPEPPNCSSTLTSAAKPFENRPYSIDLMSFDNFLRRGSPVLTA